MKKHYFFDTSSLIKLYHKENDTENFENIIEQVECRIVISELTLVEFNSAFIKKVRMNEIDLQDALEILDIFTQDCSHFYLVPCSLGIMKSAQGLIVKYGQSEKLVTLDSIQLATALSCDFIDVSFISDKKFASIAKQEGLFVYEAHHGH